jgi:hypothetical protein
VNLKGKALLSKSRLTGGGMLEHRRRRMAKQQISFKGLLMLLLPLSSLVAASSATLVTGQTATTYTDDTGLILDLPQGWTVYDHNNTETKTEFDTEYILDLCLIEQQKQVLTPDGSPYAYCTGTPDLITAARINVTQFMLSNGFVDNNMTAQDLVEYYRLLDDFAAPMLVDSKDVLLNNVSSSNNGTTGTPIPARLILTQPSNPDDPKFSSMALYFVVNNGTTGYEILYGSGKKTQVNDLDTLSPDFETAKQIMLSARLEGTP